MDIKTLHKTYLSVVIVKSGTIFYQFILNKVMQRKKVLLYNLIHRKVIEVKGQSLKEKTGATAEEIRKAIEIIGFDREKVEEYLNQSRKSITDNAIYSHSK